MREVEWVFLQSRVGRGKRDSIGQLQHAGNWGFNGKALGGVGERGQKFDWIRFRDRGNSVVDTLLAMNRRINQPLLVNTMVIHFSITLSLSCARVHLQPGSFVFFF